MDVYLLLPEKLRFTMKIFSMFILFTLILAVIAYLLLIARTTLQKMKSDYETERTKAKLTKQELMGNSEVKKTE
jgi:hypothetical protein